MAAGMITYDKLLEPGLDLADFTAMNEILMVKGENERRAYEAARRKEGNG